MAARIHSSRGAASWVSPVPLNWGRAQDEGVESHALSVEEGREAGGVA